MSQAAAPLLRKLRLKFIALNMALACVVLAASFATICYMDYRSDVDEVYRTLAITVNRAGERPQLVPEHGPLLPAPDGTGETASAGDGTAAYDPDAVAQHEGPAAPSGDGASAQEAPLAIGSAGGEDAAETGDEQFAPPQIGGPHGMGDNALPVATYYCESGTIAQIVDQSSAAVPDSLLASALNLAAADPQSHGYLADAGLFFAKRDVGHGLIVAFADGGAASSWQGLAWGLAGVGMAALGVLFLLNLQLSTWALGPVQRAWSQQQQFIADASHELKTPLTVILANNAILRQRGGETVASQGQWIESTQMEAERMQALVTDMLDLARPATTASAEQPTPALDFSRLVEGEALTFEAVAFERNLVWEAAVAEGISVRGHASRLQRLVAVLLDNACKYTDEGGTVEVTLRTEGAEAVLSVRNSGEPIAKEDLPHLFDRFYRADKARTQAGVQAAAPEGYGLGLAIAADIAQAHKGALTVSSTAEEGTAFTLRLPLA